MTGTQKKGGKRRTDKKTSSAYVDEGFAEIDSMDSAAYREDVSIGSPEILRQHQFEKTKPCSFYRRGMCAKMSDCLFAHDRREQRPLPNLGKTKMCQEQMQNGQCSNPRCTYAHSKDELRATPTFLKTKMCKHYIGEHVASRKKCPMGKTCRYAHSEEELQQNILRHEAEIAKVAAVNAVSERRAQRRGHSTMKSKSKDFAWGESGRRTTGKAPIVYQDQQQGQVTHVEYYATTFDDDATELNLSEELSSGPQVTHHPLMDINTERINLSSGLNYRQPQHNVQYDGYWRNYDGMRDTVAESVQGRSVAPSRYMTESLELPSIQMEYVRDSPTNSPREWGYNVNGTRGESPLSRGYSPKKGYSPLRRALSPTRFGTPDTHSRIASPSHSPCCLTPNNFEKPDQKAVAWGRVVWGENPRVTVNDMLNVAEGNPSVHWADAVSSPARSLRQSQVSFTAGVVDPDEPVRITLSNWEEEDGNVVERASISRVTIDAARRSRSDSHWVVMNTFLHFDVDTPVSSIRPPRRTVSAYSKLPLE